MKSKWSSPVLEVLSTSKTAFGGQGAPDTFHTADSDPGSEPSRDLPPVS